ncbi:hypothetical protein KBTX_04386 [wastewater metagenome]|uniref:Uncharacterized protein n=4 Tax=root TaxID=1 RepID=A0A5B8RJ23_9ZZZZ|nr:hypothetical protein KBTEX_04386 [uncultured organism]
MISYEEALRHADSQNEVRLMIKLGDEGSRGKMEEAAESMTLKDE